MESTRQKQLNKYIECSLAAKEYAESESAVWEKIDKKINNQKSIFSILYHSVWLKIAVITLLVFGLTFGLVINGESSKELRDKQVNEVVVDQTLATTSADESNTEQVVAETLVEKSFAEIDNSSLINNVDTLLDNIDKELEIINPNEDFADFEL